MTELETTTDRLYEAVENGLLPMGTLPVSATAKRAGREWLLTDTFPIDCSWSNAGIAFPEVLAAKLTEMSGIR